MISFAAGQAAFTVVVLVLFNIIAPTGWKVGILRIEDVAVGFAISLGVGLVFWPRGAAALLRQNLAAAYSRTSDYVAAMVEELSGLDGGANPGRAELAATTSVHRLDDSFSQYLAERSAQRIDPERVTRMVGGAAKVLRTGQSLATLNSVAGNLPMLGQSPNGPGTALPISPADHAESGGAKPCAGHLDQKVLALRAWYVTLGDSLVNGTAVPPPERRDAAPASGCSSAPGKRSAAASPRWPVTRCWSCGPTSISSRCGGWRSTWAAGRTPAPRPPTARRLRQPRPPRTNPGQTFRNENRSGAGPGQGLAGGWAGCQLGGVVRSRIVTSRPRRLASMSPGYSVPMSVST